MPGAPSLAAVAAVGCSASLLATGCADGGDGGAPTPTSATATEPVAAGRAVRAATVDIASFKFVPRPVTIAAGGSVTWVNRDKAPHTAQNTGERAPATFDTGRLTHGQKKFISFSAPGTYHYYCVYHRFMEADVIVR